ncbi:tandem-95 repeat protein [Comamonas testosteroni]|uniref:Tandem-95 repeat protein n=1 Tax=Comamonas testosteroni TaxID=285 RepID=A0A373F3M4_COMTE|nr:Ig-like domain-containing protein [Comamonas testosteroni]RGE38557.1 tandem-95 repeat protein [Comamonas testosteroni]
MNTNSLTMTGTLAQINSWLGDTGSGRLMFLPSAQSSGPVTLTITANDQGGTGSPGPLQTTDTRQITVTPRNSAPTGADSVHTLTGAGAVYTFSAADFGFADAADTPANNFKEILVTAIPPAGYGSLKLNGVDVTVGQHISAADLSGLTYTAGANGYVAGLGFKVVDDGGTANNGKDTDPMANTVSFRVGQSAEDTGTTPEDTAITGNVLTNDVPLDGGKLTVSSFTVNGITTTVAAGGSGTATIANVGTLVMNSNGSYTFTPVADYNGSVPVVTYTATETVNVQVFATGKNDDGTDTTANTADKHWALVNGPGNQSDATVSSHPWWPGTPVIRSDLGGVALGNYIYQSNFNIPAGADLTTTLNAMFSNFIVGADDPNKIQVFVNGQAMTLTSTGRLVGGNPVEYYATLPAGSSNPLHAGQNTITVVTGNTNDLQAFYTNGGVSVYTHTTTNTLTLTVTPVADIVADFVTTDEDTAVSFNPITGSGTTNAFGSATSGADNFEGSPVVTAINGANLVFTSGTATVTLATGVLTVQSNGDMSFAPNADYNGDSSFTYTVTSPTGVPETDTVTIRVNPVNDAPTRVGTVLNQTGIDSVAMSTPLDVSSAFTDVDGDTLAYTATGLPPGLTISAAGVISGTPDHDASVRGANNGGVYTVTVTADDGHGGTTTQTFTWTVTNPAPTATADTLAITENQIGGGNVLGNDSDPDGDTLAVSQIGGQPVVAGGTSVAGSSGGTFTMKPDGTYSFDPGTAYDYLAAGETATSTVDYQISDGQGGFAVATITVTITGTNDAPTTASPLPAQTGVDAASVSNVSVVGGFHDVDTSDVLTYTATGLPPGLALDPNTGLISGTIDHSASQGGPNSDGIYSVTVTANDAHGGTVSQTFSWTVTNPAPTATADTLAITENQIGGGSVLGNDTDPDLDLLTVTQIGGQAVVTGGTSVAGSTGGTFTMKPDGTYSFDPGTAYDYLAMGETATSTVDYQISDGQGGFAVATITVTITGTNDAPTTASPLPAQTGVDAASVSNVSVVGGFHDVDTSDVLTYTATGLPPGLALDPNTGLISGTIDHSASQGGPNSDGIYSVTVTANDAHGGTVSQTFSWTVTNPAPTATADTLAITENQIGNGSVLGNDSDPDGDTLSVSQVGGVAVTAGTPTTVAGSNGGQFTMNADGSYTFNPGTAFDHLAVGETATSTVTYEISDGQGGTSTATITVTITGTNDAPTPVGSLTAQTGTDAVSITPVNVSGAFTDVDASDVLTYTATGLPAGLSLDAVTGVISGTLDHSASVSSPNNDGTYTVIVTADDGHGGTTTQTFTWTVTNPAPVATDDALAVTENQTSGGNVLGNDSDPDGDTLSVSHVGGVAVTAGTPTTVAGSNGGQFTMNADGSYTFNPGTAFDHLAVSETATSTVTYEISDGQGGTSTATITVTITGTNDAPTPVGSLTAQTGTDAVSITPVNVSGAFTDVDASDVLTYTATGLPPGLSLNPATGLITGTIDPSASQGGTGGATNGEYTVVVTADDGHGGTTTQTFTWKVSNPAPIASDDALAVTENQTSGGNVLGNDTDPDGDPLTVTTVGGTPVVAGTPTTVAGSNGGSFTMNADGSYTFTPGTAFDYLAAGETATTTVSYQISDGQGGFSTSTITVTVTGLNDAPSQVGTLSTQTGTDAQTGISVDVTGGFHDVDTSDVLTYAATGLPPGLSLNPATGLITGTIDPSASQGGTGGATNGEYTVVVTADDGHGGTVTQTFTWKVTNPAPVATNDALAVTENQTSGGNVLGNDTDTDGDPLTVTTVGGTPVVAGTPTTVAGSNGGSFTMNADGSYTFTPGTAFDYLAVGETATTTVSYIISDGQGGTSTATITVTVTGTNDAPVDGDEVVTVTEDQVLNVPAANGLLANTSDVDGGTPSVTTFSVDINGDGSPEQFTAGQTATIAGVGTLTINADGSYTFAPSADYHGPVPMVSYTVSDGHGGTDTSTLTLSVKPVNDAPVANPDSQIIPSGSAATGNVLANDTDVDGDQLSVTGFSINGSSYTAGSTAVIAGVGKLTVASDGSYSFIPESNYSGSVPVVSYTISDGQVSTTSTLRLVVDASPVLPVPPTSPSPFLPSVPQIPTQPTLPLSQSDAAWVLQTVQQVQEQQQIQAVNSDPMVIEALRQQFANISTDLTPQVIQYVIHAVRDSQRQAAILNILANDPVDVSQSLFIPRNLSDSVLDVLVDEREKQQKLRQQPPSPEETPDKEDKVVTLGEKSLEEILFLFESEVNPENEPDYSVPIRSASFSTQLKEQAYRLPSNIR